MPISVIEIAAFAVLLWKLLDPPLQTLGLMAPDLALGFESTTSSRRNLRATTVLRSRVREGHAHCEGFCIQHKLVQG